MKLVILSDFKIYTYFPNNECPLAVQWAYVSYKNYHLHWLPLLQDSPHNAYVLIHIDFALSSWCTTTIRFVNEIILLHWLITHALMLYTGGSTARAGSGPQSLAYTSVLGRLQLNMWLLHSNMCSGNKVRDTSQCCAVK